jgi:hypothetical protein
MAYQKHTPKPLIVRVADAVFDKTTVGQEAMVIGFHFKRDVLSLECEVNVDLLVTPRSILPDGSLGEVLKGKLFRTYTQPMNAANDTLVNATTGDVLKIRGQMLSHEWEEAIEEASKDVDTKLQGDWFEDLCAHAAVEIDPLLRKFISDADNIGFFLR